MAERLVGKVAIITGAGGGIGEATAVRFASGGHIACAGVGIPLPINWGLPDRPAWGAQAKQMDRDFFNHSMTIAMVMHDMPRHDNRVDLDDKVKDAWGLPVARITLKPHPNDLAQARWIIDHNAEILEAARANL